MPEQPLHEKEHEKRTLKFKGGSSTPARFRLVYDWLGTPNIELMERNYCWWKLFQQTIWNRDISLYLECFIYGIYTRLSSFASTILPGDPHITRKQLFVVFKSIFKVLKIWKYKQTSICKITGILWHTVYIFTPCAPSQVTLHLLQINTKSHKTRFRDNNFVHEQFSAWTKTVVQSVKFTRRKCWRCRICSCWGGKGGILGFLSQNYKYFLELPYSACVQVEQQKIMIMIYAQQNILINCFWC